MLGGLLESVQCFQFDFRVFMHAVVSDMVLVAKYDHVMKIEVTTRVRWIWKVMRDQGVIGCAASNIVFPGKAA